MATDPSRLHVFIDGGYIFNVFDPYRKLGYRYSCKRLVRLLSMNYQLLAVHYVSSINLRDAAIKERQERFYYGQLRDKLGWDVHILPLQWPGGQAQQKGTDSVITLLLHDLAVKNAYDTGILLAADSDFVPPVQAVITHGKIVRNAYFSRRPSFHLQQACNGPPVRLDDLDFLYKNGDPIHLVTPASLKAAPNATSV